MIFPHSAQTIARPLLANLAQHPFSGRVMGRFRRACNFIDDAGRILTLTLPEPGNGPFSIVIAGQPGLFETLSPNQTLQATDRFLSLGSQRITLHKAKIWEPTLPRLKQPFPMHPLTEIIKPYTVWPRPNNQTALAGQMAHIAAKATTQLKQALTPPPNRANITKAAAQLAGLGQGLTPAGDDYLVGVMAALQLTDQKDIIPDIAKAALPKTTALSQAFLSAASKGQFFEPWHRLTQTLATADRQTITAAVENIAHFGASSGLDALAGFGQTLLL